MVVLVYLVLALEFIPMHHITLLDPRHWQHQTKYLRWAR